MPKEGRGVTTWWAGSNGRHLGPGCYKDHGVHSINSGELNEYSSSFQTGPPRSIAFEVVGGTSRGSQYRWSMTKPFKYDLAEGVSHQENPVTCCSNPPLLCVHANPHTYPPRTLFRKQSVWARHSAESTMARESSVQRFERSWDMWTSAVTFECITVI